MPKDYLTTSFLAELKAYIDDKAAEGGGGGGGGSSGLVVNAVYDEQTEITTLDKTWNEIKNAVASGEPTYIFWYTDETEYNYRSVVDVKTIMGSYVITTYEEEYVANSADSYPVLA